MKQKLFLIALTISVCSVIMAYPVVRGERPIIDMTRMTDDAFHQGHIRIKISPNLSHNLDSAKITSASDGTVLFGIDSIDELNRRYSVQEAIKLFENQALDNGFEERHRAWGFHLWYEIHFSEKHDTRKVLAAYDSLSEIEIAEPEYKKELHFDPLRDFSSGNPNRWIPNDHHFQYQWNLRNLGYPIAGLPGADLSMFQAWQIEKGLSDVIVAVLDQGIDYNHEDLAENMWTHLGYNFVNNNMILTPGNHGTLVGGVISAVTNNNIGIAGIAGGSGSGDGVRLMTCRIASATQIANPHLAMVYAADFGAAINQNSWGYTPEGAYEQIVLDAIDYFNVNGGGNVMQGGLTVFSSGNNDSSGEWYPAYYSGAFAVAATNSYDVKAYYSNYGTWIDISAPGGELGGTNPPNPIISTIIGNDYDSFQGTSIAAPHVSAVAALILSYAYRYGIVLANSTVADIIYDSADYIDHYNSNYVGMLGTGRLNAHAALLETENYLGNIMNPSFFTAEPASISQIDLSWIPNNNGNEVMVIWSSDNIFGTPADGIVYNEGDTIPGGGMVLYRGSSTTYSHTGLDEATTYYYAAFSFTALNEYSEGRYVQASTDYHPFTLPFSENFDASLNLPDFWIVVDHMGQGQTWEVGTTGGGLTGTEGNYAYLNSLQYGMNNFQDSDLITPVMDLSSNTEVILSFTHYFRSDYNNSTGTILYSVDDGETWHVIQSWSSTIPNPSYFNEIIPEAAGQPLVRFKWRYESTWDRNWCIDDVMIIDSSMMGTIEGNVTLLDGMGDVEQVVISASGISTNPEANGDYFLSVPPGTYQVTATLDNYEQQTISDVVVNTGAATSGIDFALEFIPPPAPQNLTAVPGHNVIDLNWSPPSGVTERTSRKNLSRGVRRSTAAIMNYNLLGYNVYRNDQIINTEIITGEMYEDNDVVTGETYQYYVTALYDVGESYPSGTATILVPGQVTSPVFSPGEGEYHSPVEITITTDTDDAFIYYTTDGSEPTEDSHLYIQPFVINETTTLTAKAFKEDWFCSDISTAEYTITLSGETAFIEPLITALGNAFPNPFNPDTTISFSLAETTWVTLSVYNITGQTIQVLLDARKHPAGHHHVVWNGRDSQGREAASGIYFYKLQTGDGYQKIRKMALIK